MRPVLQNAQPFAQPTCDETQSVENGRSSDGITTASTAAPVRRDAGGKRAAS